MAWGTLPGRDLLALKALGPGGAWPGTLGGLVGGALAPRPGGLGRGGPWLGPGARPGALGPGRPWPGPGGPPWPRWPGGPLARGAGALGPWRLGPWSLGSAGGGPWPGGRGALGPGGPWPGGPLARGALGPGPWKSVKSPQNHEIEQPACLDPSPASWSRNPATRDQGAPGGGPDKP